jgi:hypothetical protein
MILVRGISISKTRSEFFNLKRFRGVECKIQAGIVNARIKNVTKKISQQLKQSAIWDLRNCCRAGAPPDKPRPAFNSHQHPASDALALQRISSASDHAKLNATGFAISIEYHGVAF